MREQPQMQLPEAPQPDRGRFSFAVFVAAAAVVIGLAGFYFLPGRQSPSRGNPEAHPPFGAEERAYASKVRVENLSLSRAENFLHQEVTILSGELVNDGDRNLAEIELTVEFFDVLNQAVLREPRLALAPPAQPLAAGERRTFEISFEHISTSWNMQLPTARVTGLLFAAAK
jgi:hypothetical protein